MQLKDQYSISSLYKGCHILGGRLFNYAIFHPCRWRLCVRRNMKGRSPFNKDRQMLFENLSINNVCRILS